MNARAAAVDALKVRLGHDFHDASLLERALTHASVGGGGNRVRDNEVLEFIGDRVIGLLAAEQLAALDRKTLRTCSPKAPLPIVPPTISLKSFSSNFPAPGQLNSSLLPTRATSIRSRSTSSKRLLALRRTLRSTVWRQV